jgi:hypothetical protein
MSESPDVAAGAERALRGNASTPAVFSHDRLPMRTGQLLSFEDGRSLPPVNLGGGDHNISMAAFARDVLFGVRLLRRSPWFTAIVVLTLGLGIAVNTTVFSWINSVLLHPFPGVGDPQELALIETVTPSGEYLVNTSVLDYVDYRDNLKLVSGVALGRFTPLSVCRHTGSGTGLTFAFSTTAWACPRVGRLRTPGA